SLASGSRVQLFDPTVTCTGKSFQNATRLALPGLFLWTFGVPVCIFLSLLYYLSSLEEVRYTLVFTFVCDFYRKKLCWWDSLRLTFISLLIFVALYPFPTGKSSFLTILISLYTACFALVKPYGSETIEPWIVLKKNRCTRGIKLPRTHHLRELLMWIDLALAFQFDSIRISLPNDVR
ncbi:transmembrane, partial [Cystoisospora suis]